MASENRMSGGAVRGLLARAERFALGTAALGGTMLACSSVFAGPEGARVVRGDVQISRQGAETVIRASHNSIINYRSFDIARDESVRFIQPGSESRVLNRIESRTPTRIDGSLFANGRVYLINPNGIVFGPNSVVNVNQLYAAAGNLSDKDFVRGIDRFTNLKGEVKNYGTLTADYVGLVANQVGNFGTIVAPQGTVVMASGRDVMIGERDGAVFVRLSGQAQVESGRPATEQAGRIEAPGGRVMMGAGDIYGLAVVHSGQTKAMDVRVEGQGRGEVHVAGTIDASNSAGIGGQVRVLGEKVAITDATIDASGRDGGGSVLIGGNFQGKGPERNATRTWIGGGATIHADAIEQGDGGTVIIWADQITRYHGNITARGGERGGNGGFAEVSGKEFLVFRGRADMSAEKGTVGSILLDPRDITIVNTGADDALMSDNIVNFNEPDTTTDITLSNEVLEVNADTTLQAERDIFVNQAVSNNNAGRSITMFAGRHITVSSSISTRGGAISLTAGNRGDGSGDATGSVTVNAALDTTNSNATGGTISLTSGSSGTITLGANLTTRAGAVTITGPAAINGARTIDTGEAGNNTAPISFSSTITGDGGDTLTLTAGAGTGRSAVTLSGSVSGLDGLTITQASTITSNGLSTTAGGNVSVNHTGTHTVNGSINIGGTYTQAGGGGTTFSSGAGITTSNDNITFANAITISTNTEFSVGTGTIDLNGTTSIGSGFTLTLTSDEEVQLNGGANSITGPGSLVIRPATAVETRISGTTGAGRLDIINTDLGAIDSSVGQVTIGNSAVNAALNINSASAIATSTTFVTGGVLSVGADVTVSSGTLRLHGGFDGGFDAGGSLRFSAVNVDLASGTLELRAGSGSGTSTIDAITNTPTFRGASGGATRPNTFTYQQDATIADADIPAASQFAAAFASMGYNLTSTNGDVTIATASKVANAALAVSGQTVSINANIAPFGTTITGTNMVNLNGNIATTGTGSGAAIQINGDVTLGADVTLSTNTAAAGANIGIAGDIFGTTDATEDLFINAGTSGAVTLGGAVGTSALRLNTFQVTNSGSITASNGIFAVLIEAGATTTATYNGILDATSGGIDLAAATINLNAGASTSAGGTFDANSGTAFTIGGVLTLDGAFTKVGAGTTSLGANITTTGDAIAFSAGAVSLTAGTVSLDTTAGGNSAGANITFAGTLNGASALTINAGTGGTVTFSSAVGGTTPLSSLAVSNSGTTSVSAGATITGAMSVTAGTAFNATGSAISSGSFTKAGAGGSNVGVNITTNNAALTFAGGSLTFTGNSTLSAGTGTITTQGVNIAGFDVSLFANSFDFQGGSASITGTGSGTLRFGGASNATTIGVAGGAGTCQVTATNLNALANEATGTLVFGRSGQTGAITVGTSTYHDSTVFSTTGALTTTGTITTDDSTDSDLTLTGSAITLGGNIVTPGRAISLSGPVTLSANVTLDTTNGGLSPAGANITLASTINGTSGGVDEDVTFRAGTSGDVSIAGAAGSATALGTFRIASASEATLGAVTATTIDITTTGSGTSTFGAMSATTIGVTTASASTANYNGLLSAGAGGITLNGGIVNLNAGATTTGNGAFAVTTSNTFAVGSVALTLDGAFTKSGAGTAAIGAGISTTNDNITFNSSASIDNAGLTLSAGTGTVTFNSTLALNGSGLTLHADGIDFLGGANTVTGTGIGTLRLGGSAGSTTIGVAGGAGTLQISTTDLDALANGAAALIAIGRVGQTGAINIAGGTFKDAATFSTTGTISITGNVLGSLADASLTFTSSASTINVGANVTTAGANINMFAPVVLTANSTWDTTNAGAVAAGADITATDSIDGAFDLTLRAGTGGDIGVTGVVGGGTRVGALTVVSVADTTAIFSDDIFASSYTQNSGSAVFNGVVDTNGAAGISLTGTAFTFNAGVNTTGGGGLTIVNSGTLTIANAPINLDGVFSKSGAGTTNLGADVTTTNDNITFTGGDTTLTADVSISTGAGTGFVAFNSSVTGAQSLSIAAGTGTVGFGAAVGSTPLSNLTVLSSSAISVVSTLNVAGTVNLTSTGNVSISGAVFAGGGFSSAGVAFTQAGGITTTNNNITISHSGAVSSAALSAGTGDISITGATIDQNGAALGGSYSATATGAIDVGANLAAGTIDIRSGTNGTGDLFFSSPGIEVRGTTISLRAGDGTGGSDTTATVDYTTNAVIFRGLSGGATSPTTFVHRQDGTITDVLIASASQFGAGPAGIAYTLRSDDGSVNIADGSKVAGSVLTLFANGAGSAVNFSDDISVDSLTVNSVWAVSADITLETTGGTLSLLGPGDTLTSNVIFRGPEIDFGSTVVGTGSLAFQPLTAGGNVIYAGSTTTGDLDLTASELGFFADGFASLTIGRTDGTGTIQSAGAFTALDPFTLMSPGGSIRVEHALTGSSGASLTFDGPVFLAADIITAANAISFLDTVELGADVLVDATDGGGSPGGASVTFSGPVDADAAANNRTLTVDTGGSGATFNGAIGSGQALGALTVSGFTINLSGARTNRSQIFNGALTTDGDLRTLAGGDVTVNGSLILAGDVVIQTNGSTDGNATFNGQVDSDGVTPRALTVDAGSGNVVFANNVGQNNALLSLTVAGADLTIARTSTSTDQTYNASGSIFFNGDLSGQGITVNGASVLNSNILVTGSSFVNFGGTINSATGLARTLAINSPITTLSDSIGSAAGGALGALTTDSAGTTTISGGLITTVNAQSYGDNVVLGSDTTLTSTNLGDITFAGTLNSDGTSRSLSVNTGGGSFFNAQVGNVAALASLTTDAPGFTRLGANVTLIGAGTFADAVQISNNLTMNLASASFGAAVDTLDIFNPKSLTITASGAVTFSQGVGQTAYLSALAVTGSTISLKNVQTAGNQAYTGSVTLDGALLCNSTGSLTITGNLLLAGHSTIQTQGGIGRDITITGTINGTGGSFDLGLDAHGDPLESAANVIIGGDVGLGVGPGIFALSALQIVSGQYNIRAVNTTGLQLYEGSGTLHGNLTSGTGGIAFDGGVVLADNISISTTDGAVNFMSTLDSDLTARALSLSIGGSLRNAVFGGAVGGLRPLASLTVSNPGAGAISINGGTIATTPTGDQTYNGRIVLGADATLSGNDITFGSTVDSDATARILTVSTSGSGVTRFNAGVGASSRLARLVTNADGTTRFGADVRTSNGLEINDALLIGADVLVDAGSGQMLFRAGINAAPEAVLPRLFLHTTFDSTATDQAIRLGGNIGASGIFRGVSINAGAGFTPRTTPQRAATVVFSDSFNGDGTINPAGASAGDVFTIVAGSEGFRMGAGEKMTVFGTLRIVGSGESGSNTPVPGEVRLGDITALGDIVIRANTIRFVARGAGSVFEKQVVNNTVLPTAPIVESADLGRADIVAGGSFDFVGSLVDSDRSLVVFSNTLGQIGGALASAGFSIRNFSEGSDGVTGGVSLDLFRDPINPGTRLFGLDLRARGNPGSSIATSIAGAIPRDPQTREVETPVTVGRSLREPLQEMGVYVRDLRFEELLELLVGWGTYRDIPEDRARPRYEVALNRLDRATVESAIEAYRSLLYVPRVGPNGEPVLDEQGKPQLDRRAEIIQTTIGIAWETYAASASEPTGEGFRAYLEARGEAATQEEQEALEYLNAARVVFVRIDALGLAPFEAAIPKNRLISEITPPGMTDEQMRAAVMGKQLAMF
jgi:filamentous hemagglutinin family protein